MKSIVAHHTEGPDSRTVCPFPSAIPPPSKLNWQKNKMCSYRFKKRLELFDEIEGCLQMVPLDAVVGWLRYPVGTIRQDRALSSNGSARRCCWMAPLSCWNYSMRSRAVFKWFRGTLLLDGSAVLLELFDEIEGCRQMVPRDAVVGWLLVVGWFFRSRLLGWKGCAIKGCCCEIMCVLSSVGRVSRLLQGKNQTVF